MSEEQPEIAINGDSEQPGAKPDSKPEAEKVESEPQNETDPTSQPSNGEEAAVTESEAKEENKVEKEKLKEEKRQKELEEKARKQKEREAKEEEKKRMKEEKQKKKRSKKEAQVQVTLLDDTKQVFSVRRKCKASVLFDEVFTALDLSEKDYFSLYYLDNNMRVYLDPLKSAKRQIPVDDDGVWRLFFGVKYYIEDPSVFKEDITRYQYVLQVCRDIKVQRIQVPIDQLNELLVLVVQSSVGDYKPEEHPEGYTHDFIKFFYPSVEAAPPDTEDKVRELHKRKKDMYPEECEVSFLQIARSLSRYGIHTYTAQDNRQNQVIIGISFRGLTIFHEAKEIHKFDWSDIVRVGFSKKRFKIWFDPSLEKPENFKPSLLELTFHNQSTAKRLWVVCAEQHTFFRRPSPTPQSAPSRFSFSFKRGSKFRYSGRTLKQLKEAEPRPSQPDFKRTYSERFSRPQKPKVKRSASLTEDRPTNVVAAEIEPNLQRDLSPNDEEIAEGVRTFLRSEYEKAPEDEQKQTEEPKLEPATVEEPQKTEEPVPEPQETQPEPVPEPQETQPESVPEPQETQPELVPEPQPEPVPEPQETQPEPEAQVEDTSAELQQSQEEITKQPEDDAKSVEDDAKALVDNVIEDASKKMSEDED